MYRKLLLFSMLFATNVFAMPQNYDQIANVKNNFINQKNSIVDGIGKSAIDFQEAKLRATAAGLRNFGREEARKESEHKLSQLDSYYTNLQKKTNDYLNLKPIVDNISEREKYGNDGGINRVGSIAFINAYEKIANVVNAIFEVPSDKVQVAAVTAGEVLRYLGRSIAGL